jgi:hypothetical protein
MEFGKSFVSFVWGITKRLYWLLPSLLSDPFDIAERWFRLNYDAPPYLVWILIGIGFFIAALLEYHSVRTKIIQIPMNWIEKYVVNHKGALPPIDDYMVPFISGAVKGQKVSKDMVLLRPTFPRQWEVLGEIPQEKLLQLADYIGKGRAQWLAEIGVSLPKSQGFTIVPSRLAKK